jgi:hypothetical protein
MQNFKCSGIFGGLPNAFNIGTPENPFFQGTTPTLTVTVYQPDGVTPVVLTGAKIYLTVKADPADADPGLFQLSTTGGSIVISTQSGAPVGQFVATFPASATVAAGNLQPGLQYPFDCRVILAGNVQTVVYGELTLMQAITQAVT